MTYAAPKLSTTELLRQLGAELLTLADELDVGDNQFDCPAGREREQPRWISLKQATAVANRKRDTVVAWAKRFKLGHKLPGGRSARWLIDETALRRHLASTAKR